jgi:hypothetical protein
LRIRNSESPIRLSHKLSGQVPILEQEEREE